MRGRADDGGDGGGGDSGDGGDVESVELESIVADEDALDNDDDVDNAVPV